MSFQEKYSNHQNKIISTESATQEFREKKHYIRFCETIKSQYPDAIFTKGDIGFEANISNNDQIVFDKYKKMYFYQGVGTDIIRESIDDLLSELQKKSAESQPASEGPITPESLQNLTTRVDQLQYNTFKQEILENIDGFTKFIETLTGYTAYTVDGQAAVDYNKYDKTYTIATAHGEYKYLSILDVVEHFKNTPLIIENRNPETVHTILQKQLSESNPVSSVLESQINEQFEEATVNNTRDALQEQRQKILQELQAAQKNQTDSQK